MNDDARYVLDSVLVDWHRWAKGYSQAGGYGAQPMFSQAQSPRGWDTAQEIVESEIEGGRMAAVNFHIFELPPEQCTAIQIHARNLYTGKNVWTSQRLPSDLGERAVLVAESRNALMRRLIGAGVI